MARKLNFIEYRFDPTFSNSNVEIFARTTKFLLLFHSRSFNLFPILLKIFARDYFHSLRVSFVLIFSKERVY